MRKFKIGDVVINAYSNKKGTIVEVEPDDYDGDLVYKVKYSNSVSWASDYGLILADKEAMSQDSSPLTMDVLNDYITEDMVDFTGCDPIIAMALKNNKKIRCVVSDTKQKKEGGISYVIGHDSVNNKYKTSLFSWAYAEPIKKPKKATIVKSYEEIVKWLLVNGYKPYRNFWSCYNKPNWINDMFAYCDKEPNNAFRWLPEWLTEKEM